MIISFLWPENQVWIYYRYFNSSFFSVNTRISYSVNKRILFDQYKLDIELVLLLLLTAFTPAYFFFFIALPKLLYSA